MPPRPLTDTDKEQMRSLVSDLVGRTFVPDAGVTLGGQPVRDFLAGSAPANPLGAMQHSMGRSACDSWARGDGSGIPPRREALMRDTCTPYIDLIGTPPAGSVLGPPFEGGQCTGTVYRLSYGATVVRYLDGVQIGTGSRPFGTSGTFNYAGPITGVTREPNTFGTTGLPQSWKFVVSYGAGLTRETEVNITDAPPIGGRTEERLRSLRVAFTRFSGGSDVCGDPADQWDAGNPGTDVPGPTTIPSPPGFDIPFPGIKVKLNPDGTINIDFGDGGPPLVVDPGIDPDSPSGADPGPPEAGTSGATGEGGEEEGEAPEDKELWALKIDITQFPEDPNEYAPGVYRGVCYIYMGDENGLDHDPAGAMLSDGQLVLAEKEGLTKWRVSSNPGYDLTVTPYYRTPRRES